jgi:hypothetical protein
VSIAFTEATDATSWPLLDGRLWDGVHSRFSDEIGVDVGRRVARHDLRSPASAVRGDQLTHSDLLDA